MNIQTLKRRVEALQPSVLDGYEPVTTIERVIVDMDGKPIETITRHIPSTSIRKS